MIPRKPATTAAGKLQVRSPVFAQGEAIPRRFSGEGEDVSPPILWSGAPADTATFALICEDPDVPGPGPWVHWVVYNIPAGAAGLNQGGGPVPAAGRAEGQPASAAAAQLTGAQEGRNSWGRLGYGGPMPPRNHGPHHYHFKVFALNRELEFDAGRSRGALLAAMKDRVLAEGELVGTYQR